MFARTIMHSAWLIILLAGFAQAAGESIRDIQIKSLDGFTADDGDVRAVIRAKVGDTVTQASLNKDVTALLATKRYSAASTSIESLVDGIRVVYTIERRPTVFGELEITGVDYFSRSKVETWLALPEGSAVDQAILKTQCNKVRSEYLTRYFPQTVITATLTPVEAPNQRKGLVRVHIKVEEGARLKPDMYVFEGNQNFSDKELRATFGEYAWWNPRGWFSTSPYSEDQLAKARQQAVDVYRNAGYLDVKISDARFVPLKDDPKRATVQFSVEEGVRYTIAGVVLTGVNLFPEAAVRKNITTLKPGATASSQDISAAAKAVRDYYTSRGYIDTAVGVSAKANDAANTSRATIVFDVQEGILVKVRQIIIRGNERTKDKVIRREIQLNPLDTMDGVKIEQNENRIKNLNIFDKDQVRHSIPANQPGEAPDSRDLIFDVKETRTGSFMIGGGFSSVDKLVGYVQMQQGNFDILNWPDFTGGGQKARASLEIGASHQSYELGWTEPWFRDKPMALSVDLFYRTRDYDEYSQKNLGGDVGIKYPVKFAGVPFGAFGLRYTLEKIDLRNLSTNTYWRYDDPLVSYRFSDEPDSAINSALQASWEYDTRDQVFVPTRGTSADIFGEVAGSVLGGDSDVFRLGGSYKHWFNPWMHHVLSLRSRIETVSAYGNEPVPIYDRLFLGGGRTVRGIRYRDAGPKVVDASLPPTEQHPVGGATLGLVSLEYNIPVFDAVRFALFTDIGNLKPAEYDFTSLTKDYCWTYGAGLRIDIPGFPIRIDYAVPRRTDDDLTRTESFVFWIGFE
ncbi:MAG: outer membrane protein assembly factor BamA [bacterium]